MKLFRLLLRQQNHTFSPSQWQKTRLRLYVQAYHLNQRTMDKVQCHSFFPLPSTHHRFHLKSSTMMIIANSSSTGWKPHLNPGQISESSQSLCSCRIFGHCRPPFDGGWMMRRFRSCLNLTIFPAEQRQIRDTRAKIYLRKRCQAYVCDRFGSSATIFEDWTPKMILNLWYLYLWWWAQGGD